MSDVQTRIPAAPAIKTVTDSLGRVLGGKSAVERGRPGERVGGDQSACDGAGLGAPLFGPLIGL